MAASASFEEFYAATVDRLLGHLFLVTGDLLVHAVQLVDPDLAYAHEVDPDLARTSRRAALRTHSPTVLATPHLATPFTPPHSP